MQEKKLAIIIPAFNEEKTIESVICDLKNFGNVIVIDDCSTDNTYRVSNKQNITVIKNNKNFGYDRAIYEGIKYSVRKDYDFCCTFDADAQHSSEDLKEMIKMFKYKKIDLLIGNRPKSQRLMESFFNLHLKRRENINDIFCGVKIYSKKLCKEYLDEFKYNNFGTKVALKAIRAGAKFEQFEVKVFDRKDSPRVKSLFINLKIFIALIRDIFR